MSNWLTGRLSRVGVLGAVDRLGDKVDELASGVSEDAALNRALRPHMLELERTIMEHVAAALAAGQELDA